MNSDSGIRILVSGHSIDEGSKFQDPANMAVDADGHIVVVERHFQAIVGGRPDTGDRKIVAEEVLTDGILGGLSTVPALQ